MTKTLFTTVWQGHSIKKLLIKYNFDKIVFLKDILHGQTTQNKIISDLKKDIKDIISVEEENIGVYDIYSITKDISELIKTHSKEEIYFNLTEGRKTQMFAIYLSISLNRELIKDVFYVTEEDSEPTKIISLPILGKEELTPTEKRVLLELTDKQLKARQIAQNLAQNEIYTFRVLKELIIKKYVEKENDEYKLTNSGQIMILGWDYVKS